MLTAQQIRELMEKATKGPWAAQDISPSYVLRPQEKVIVVHGNSWNDAAFIAALPVIAETALGALSRLESAEARIHNEFVMKNIKFCFIGCPSCERKHN